MMQQGTTELTAGSIFQDRYEIDCKISRGAFGTVFRARQLATGQLVAIKCLHRRGWDQEEDRRIVARFQREIQLCAELQHPNIVRLIDTGRTSDDLFYTVFEYIPGQTLREAIDSEGRLHPVEAGHIMGQLLDALSCAHSHGIIHRDLKPSNIMITPSGARRNAMILDFGIGGFVKEMATHGGVQLTASTDRIGTPLYCAPEQLQGAPTTTCSDLYSWGLVFIECLTGQRAISGKTLIDVIREQSQPDPIPIPVALHGHPLGKLLRLVTAKDPQDRRTEATELLTWLESCDLSKIDPELVIQERGAASAVTRTIHRRKRNTSASEPAAQGPSAQPAPGLPYRPRAVELRGLVEDQNRQLTVVSCSIQIASSGASSLALSGADKLLRQQREFCAKLAHRFGGYTVMQSEHRSLVFFGYPGGQADEPQRAARVALQLRDKLQLRSAMLACSGKGAIAVKIGVHTGLLTVRERGSRPTFAGAAIGVAAQLEVMAEPGTVLVSETTQQLVARHFELSVSDDRQLLGHSRPLKVFELVGVAQAPVGLDAPDRTTPLIGRDREMDMLRDRWRVAHEGRGQSVLVVGEAGVGKSRLLGELSDDTSGAERSWLVCRCRPEHRSKVLHPIVEMFEHKLGYHIGMDPAERLHSLKALMSDYQLSCDELMPVLTPLLALPDSAQRRDSVFGEGHGREFTLRALASLLLGLVAKRPFVLAVEDLHWADDATVDLLSIIMDEMASRPFFLVMTARPQLRRKWGAAELEIVALGRLSCDDTHQMIEKIVGGTVPDRAAEQLFELTGGLPLYIEEVSGA
ncbi:MAG: protein kinase, partial [Myxococcota bacterium]